MVNDLTNEYKSDKYPELNRAERKARELERLAKIHPEAKLIKACDRFDNLQDLRNHPDDKFARMYIRESIKLSEALAKGCDNRVWHQLADYLDGLVKEYFADCPA